MNKTIRNISPLALLTLAACKGTVGTGGFTVAGRVENGPLVNAYVFLDYNGNAKWDGGKETRVLTNGADHIDGAGSYNIPAAAGGYTLVALTTEQTVDTATEAGYGLVLFCRRPRVHQ